MAKRPLMYVGGGAIISDAYALIRQLAEKAGIPVVMTLKGLGAFPGTHELSLGMVGMHGTRYANTVITECDLLLGFGVRFDDRVTGNPLTFCTQAKKAHVDIDISEINKVVKVDYPVVGNLRHVLESILPGVKQNARAEWVSHIKELKQRFPLRYERDPNTIKPQYMIEQVRKATDPNTIVVTDVGQHQMWVAQYFPVDQPRRFITSGGLGTMGFGFPAAIGAKVGRPERNVVLFTGDGSFQMCLQELGTVMMYKMPVKVVILNNGFLGMVRQWQEMFYEKRFSHTDFKGFVPDFTKLITEGYGLPAMTIEKESEVEKGIDFLFKTDGPAFLNVKTPSTENVFPMIPAGASYTDLIDYLGD